VEKEAATYQISIEGILDKSYSSRFAGMKIHSFEANGSNFTTMTGRVVDQAQLLGVLNSLNNYQYPVISVNKISN